MSIREALRKAGPLARFVDVPLDCDELALALVDEVNPSLTHLRLETNRLTDAGVRALCRALSLLPEGSWRAGTPRRPPPPALRLQSLRTLYLSNQPGFGDPGAAHVAGVLRENGVLTWLNLQANEIGAAGAAALADALKDNTACQQVW
jgi:hypothetical protein